MKLLLLGAILLALSSCSNVNTEEKAKELCKSHGGLSGFSGSEKRAVCNDTTVVNL